MLVLARYVSQTVTLTLPSGEKIVVMLTDVQPGRDGAEPLARLGFDAPREINIVRTELLAKSFPPQAGGIHGETHSSPPACPVREPRPVHEVSVSKVGQLIGLRIRSRVGAFPLDSVLTFRKDQAAELSRQLAEAVSGEFENDQASELRRRVHGLPRVDLDTPASIDGLLTD